MTGRDDRGGHGNERRQAKTTVSATIPVLMREIEREHRHGKDDRKGHDSSVTAVREGASSRKDDGRHHDKGDDHGRHHEPGDR
jgi:hypothetical protein